MDTVSESCSLVWKERCCCNHDQCFPQIFWNIQLAPKALKFPALHLLPSVLPLFWMSSKMLHPTVTSLRNLAGEIKSVTKEPPAPLQGRQRLKGSQSDESRGERIKELYVCR
ncbi:hypothetical protein H1C71_037559 [Ictidomys tridecemlineatus]|nr:hypothetical protein H1C71_037559 [Ictidomys tridecemlineatus]KAG3276901.1 hypothetical protein H1C71_037559 [Ictidomys tridecemlineatus]